MLLKSRVRWERLPWPGEVDVALIGFTHDLRWDDSDPSTKRLSETPLEFLADLWGFVDSCESLIGDGLEDGASELLSVTRGLFAHSWLDVDFLGVCAVVSLQAIEALFRQMLPGQESVPLAVLVTRAEKEGMPPFGIISIVRGSLELQNDMSHPLTVVLSKPAHTALLL
jgi:hypothetical protein